MLTENLISTVLTASITGAGFILAIYALITPISRRIFEERAKLHRKKKKEFDKLKKKISSESTDKDFKQLKTLAKEIKEIKIFPRYLSLGVLTVFWLYIFTATYSFGWLMNPSQEQNIIKDLVMLVLFMASTFGFCAVGTFAIVDVYNAMRGEFEQVKKEKEEVKKVLIGLTQVLEGDAYIKIDKKKGTRKQE